MQLYRPSNGTEGEAFISRWCDNCMREGDELAPCHILTATLIFPVTAPEYASQWVRTPAGPRCTAFAPRDGQEQGAMFDDRQLEIFA